MPYYDEPTQERTVNTFINFLRSKGAYEAFCKNVQDQKGRDPNSYIREKMSSEIINNAFTWGRGVLSNIWPNLHTEWSNMFNDVLKNKVNFVRYRSIW